MASEFQPRKLVKKKNEESVKSLERLCHFQVMKMCCEMANSTKDIEDNNQVLWKNSLLSMPKFLLDSLKSDFDFLCPSRTPLFQFDSFNENVNSGSLWYEENIQEEPKWFPKVVKDQVKKVYGKQQGLDDSIKVFQLWHQFFDKDSTKNIGPMLLFNTSIPKFLKGIECCALTGLCTSYNSSNKAELPVLLSLLKITLRNLRIFEDRRLQNEVIDIISQSGVTIESLRMNCLIKIDTTERFLRFLQTQEKSLKSLDLTKFLHGSCFNFQSKNPAKDIGSIFKQMSKMEKLQILYVPGIDIEYGFDDLKYLNINGLYVHIR